MLRFFLFLIFAIPALTPGALLEDPGFETQGTSWLIKNEAAASLVPEAARGGKLGLRLFLSADGARAQVDTDKLPLDGARNVKLSFWARTSGRQTGGVVLHVFNNSRKPIQALNGKPLVTIGIPASPAWIRCEGNAILPDDAAWISIAIRSWTGKEGNIDIDDFELEVE